MRTQDKLYEAGEVETRKVIGCSGIGCFVVVLSGCVSLAVCLAIANRVYHWIAG